LEQAAQGGGRTTTIPGGVQDVALRDMVCGHGGGGLTVGLNDFSGRLQL